MASSSSSEVPQHAPVYCVAITGGPCGGKSSGMAAIKEKMEAAQFRVFIVPEFATLLINNGAVFDVNFTEEQLLNYESHLLKGVLALEDVFIGIAKDSSKPTIVLMDRGTMDVKAYVSPAIWNTLLTTNQWTEAYLRDERYDAVIHMVSAAYGAEAFYQTGNNLARRETPEQARELDDKLKAVWVGHPHLTIIDNSTDFKGKVLRVASAVCKLVGLPDPSATRRRTFILEPFTLPSDLVVTECLLEDHYTANGRGRKRTVGGATTYSIGARREHTGAVAFVDNIVSGSAFSSFVSTAAEVVLTKRVYFTHEMLYINLDYVYSVGGKECELYIAGVDGTSGAIPELPSFVKVVNEHDYESAQPVYKAAKFLAESRA